MSSRRQEAENDVESSSSWYDSLKSTNKSVLSYIATSSTSALKKSKSKESLNVQPKPPKAIRANTITLPLDVENYTVVVGDSINSIALKHNMSARQLRSLNGLTMSSSRTLYPGQDLTVTRLTERQRQRQDEEKEREERRKQEEKEREELLKQKKEEEEEQRRRKEEEEERSAPDLLDVKGWYCTRETIDCVGKDDNNSSDAPINTIKRKRSSSLLEAIKSRSRNISRSDSMEKTTEPFLQFGSLAGTFDMLIFTPDKSPTISTNNSRFVLDMRDVIDCEVLLTYPAKDIESSSVEEESPCDSQKKEKKLMNVSLIQLLWRPGGPYGLRHPYAAQAPTPEIHIKYEQCIDSAVHLYRGTALRCRRLFIATKSLEDAKSVIETMKSWLRIHLAKAQKALGSPGGGRGRSNSKVLMPSVTTHLYSSLFLKMGDMDMDEAQTLLLESMVPFFPSSKISEDKTTLRKLSFGLPVFMGVMNIDEQLHQRSEKEDKHIGEECYTLSQPTVNTSAQENRETPVQTKSSCEEDSKSTQSSQDQIDSITYGDILIQEQVIALERALPYHCRGYNWDLCFSVSRHGLNMNTFFKNCVGVHPTVLLIKTTELDVLGYFSTAAWRRQATYYGNGESFCFCFAHRDDKDEESSEQSEETDQMKLKVYNWTGLNDFFMAGRNEICIGGGGGGFALHVDRDFKGHSNASLTFGNDTPLLSQKNGEMFDVLEMEIWALTSSKEARLDRDGNIHSTRLPAWWFRKNSRS